MKIQASSHSSPPDALCSIGKTGWNFSHAHRCAAGADREFQSGAYLMGVMGDRTASPGRIYFPAGTPSLVRSAPMAPSTAAVSSSLVIIVPHEISLATASSSHCTRFVRQDLFLMLSNLR
jgi:hypothetical protein